MSGDPDALERVLRNLIDNALTAIQPTGRIDVQLRRQNGCVQALVADDGPGVPEHQRQSIFERFVRLDPSRPGHGLGLAIAREAWLALLGIRPSPHALDLLWRDGDCPSLMV